MTRGVFAGLATLDVVHRVDTPPGVNQKVTALAQSVGVGGPAANAALTFAALGGAATLVTALGRSAVASLIRLELERHGVDVLDVAPDSDREPPVSAAAVQTSTGERSVVSLDAVSTRTAIPPQLATLLHDADVLLVDGHYPELGIAAAGLARQCGLPIVVDAGRWKPAMPQLIPVATDLVCSNDFRLPDHPEELATIERLASSGVDRVVMTRGGGPVIWRAGARSGEVTVPEVPVIDTLGAGDVFHGAYAFYLAGPATQVLELPARIALSIGVATERCQVEGPRAWLTATSAWTRSGDRA